MQTITKIELPEPCTQQWNNMTEAQNGRFCNNCNKTVIDFTTMTSQQIIDHLSATSHVCGRISTGQFAAVNNQLRQNNLPDTSVWKRLLLAFAVLASAQHAKAQTSNVSTPKTEQSETTKLVGKIAFPVKADNYKTITGKIVDETGAPVVQAFVSCGKKSVFTDLNGLFKLEVPADGNAIEVKSVGYETKTIKLKKGSNSYNIKIKVSSTMLGGFGVIKKPGLFKRLYYSFVSGEVENVSMDS